MEPAEVANVKTVQDAAVRGRRLLRRELDQGEAEAIALAYSWGTPTYCGHWRHSTANCRVVQGITHHGHISDRPQAPPDHSGAGCHVLLIPDQIRISLCRLAP